MIHLDTNIAIALIEEQPSAISKLIQSFEAKTPIFLSSIVYFELCYGASKSRRREHNRQRLDHLISGSISVAPFTDEAAMRAGEIRAELERSGAPIGPFDVLIAGHAMADKATLVTNNTREFSRVPGLKIEDWL